jgi:6-phosphogluconolactonase (cycloisomerase 2 family)
MRAIRFALVLVVSVLASSVHASPAPPRAAGTGLEQVREVAYENGMHLAVTRSRGRDYVFASSSGTATPGGGIRVFDVTSPAKAKQVASIPCTGGQGFLDISHDGKTLLVGEGAAHPADVCMTAGTIGFYTIDISNPRKPKPLGEAISTGAGHHLAAHPTKPFVYMAYGAPVPTKTSQVGTYEIWSIADPSKPKFLSVETVTGVNGPHDLAFSPDGSHAVASSMTALQVLDTSDPANPAEVEVLQCPGCSHNHEAHFTPDGNHVVVSDETTGGGASPCPLGALYFYAFDPEGGPYMDLLGEWQPAEVGTPADAPTNAPLCTSHVFGISDDGTKVAASWHTAGVRVVDITKMDGAGVGPHGPGGAREIGWHVEPGADAWSAKFARGGRYVFVNDANLGFQVYRISGS